MICIENISVEFKIIYSVRLFQCNLKTSKRTKMYLMKRVSQKTFVSNTLSQILALRTLFRNKLRI